MRNPYRQAVQEKSKVTLLFSKSIKKSSGSLNSLSVRVPHNISRRVCELHGPNPWLERFRGRFIVKPLFLFFIYMSRKFFSGKTNGFFTFFNFSLHLHKERYKTNAFFTFFNFSLHLHKERCKTNAFLIFLSEKTVKPVVFHVFRVLDQTRPP